MTILRHMFFRSSVLFNRLDFSVRSLRSSGYRGGHFVVNAPVKPGEDYISLPIERFHSRGQHLCLLEQKKAFT